MTSAELVAALRKCSDHRFNWNELHEINTAADFIEHVEALRHTLPCPTCSGTGAGGEGDRCWGCDDGFMSWERIVAIVAAVFDRGDEVVACSGEQVFDYLRGVRP